MDVSFGLILVIPASKSQNVKTTVLATRKNFCQLSFTADIQVHPTFMMHRAFFKKTVFLCNYVGPSLILTKALQEFPDERRHASVVIIYCQQGEQLTTAM